MADWNKSKQDQASLESLRAGLLRIDREIPVPESVKAQALLARLDEPAPGLRAVPGGLAWKKLLPAAAAFVLIIGGLWYGAASQIGGLSQAPAAAGGGLAAVPAATAGSPEASGENGALSDGGMLPESAPAEARQEMAAPQAAPAAEAFSAGASTVPPEDAPEAAAAESSAYTADAASPDGLALGGNVDESAAIVPRTASAKDAYGAFYTRTPDSVGQSPQMVQSTAGAVYYLDAGGESGRSVVRLVDGEQLSLVSTIPTEEGNWPAGLMVRGNHLAVVSSKEDPEERNTVATLHIYDVSDPSAPAGVRTFQQEGVYLESRLVEDTLYLATVISPEDPQTVLSREDATVSVRIHDTASSQQEADLALNPARPLGEDGEALMSCTVVSAIPLSPAQPSATQAVLGSGRLYFGSSAIYFIDDSQGDAFICKFSTGQGGRLEFHAAAQVSGPLAGGDPVDEWQGSFRLATVQGDGIQVTLLDSALIPQGHLSEAAPAGAVSRFWQEALYLTSSGQTPETTVIDLSRPEAPQPAESGEPAQLPRQLTALPNSRALGFGLTQGNVPALSLYDMSSPLSPRLLDSIPLACDNGILESSAAFSPTALAVDAAQGLAALPAAAYEEDGFTYAFNGAVLFRLEGDSLSYVGSASWEGEDSSPIQLMAIQGERLLAFSGSQAAAYRLPSLEAVGRAVF